MDRGLDSGTTDRTDDVTHKIVGMSLGYLHLCQLAGRGKPVVDQDASIDLGSHPLVSALEKMLGLGTGTFDEDLQGAANQSATALECDRSLHVEDSPMSPTRHFCRYGILQIRGRCPLFGAVDESAQMIESSLLDETDEVLEVRLGFTWEADDEGRA